MSDTNTSSGIGFGGLLTIVFIVLKLTDKIDWSWWWVLSPLWISALTAVVIVVVVILGVIINEWIKDNKKKYGKR